MLLDFFGALTGDAEVRDFLDSTGGVLTDLPGVLGVLKLGADCFLVRSAGDFWRSTESARSGRVKLARADLLCLGVEVLIPPSARAGDTFPPIGEDLPLTAGEDFPLWGEVLPLRGFGDAFPPVEALRSTGDTEPCLSLVREALLLAGERLSERSLVRVMAGRRPCVTRRTWHGSWRDRKCSSVSHPPPTRTIMCRPFSSWNNEPTR